MFLFKRNFVCGMVREHNFESELYSTFQVIYMIIIAFSFVDIRQQIDVKRQCFHVNDLKYISSENTLFSAEYALYLVQV